MNKTFQAVFKAGRTETHLMSMDIINIAMQLTVLIFAVIIHEVSHGFVAYKLGDPTAKQEGRLTLNPISHIDPVWSIVIPAILIFTHAGFIIGGAKPVPINPGYFKNNRRDVMLTSLAGPGSNILLAVISALALKGAMMVPMLDSSGTRLFLVTSVMINIMLAAFNLVPIPPLDGSKVLAFFLPEDIAWKYLSLETYGLIIVLLLAATGLISFIMQPILVFTQWIVGLLV